MTNPTHRPPPACLVYTPSELAGAVIDVVGPSRDADWLEPSSGEGVFLEELARRGVGKHRIRAVDLNPSRAPNDALAQTLRGVDFLRWAASTNERFDRIVGNPPYISLRDLPPRLREAALSQRGPGTEAIGLRSNTWHVFACACLSLLRAGGAFGFVLPAAFEYADYATSFRELLNHSFEEAHAFRCDRPLFDEVGEGAVVVVARGYRRTGSGLMSRRYSTRAELIRDLSSRDQDPLPGAPAVTAATRGVGVRLREIAEIRIGAVTGDASYFLLSDDRRRSLGLPAGACRPILSRSRHLAAAAIGKGEWGRLRRDKERIWLLDPPPRLQSHPAVRDYLELSEEAGGCRRGALKVSRRHPWFRTPVPSGVHGFLSGMSQGGPWIALNAMPGLSATNTLYVVRFARSVSHLQRAGWCLSILTTPVRSQIASQTRRYARGLQKVEPGDLGALVLPSPSPQRTDWLTPYSQAVSLLLRGDWRAAARLADEALRT